MSITLDEIRKQAPNGATHYRERFFGITYFRKSVNYIEMWNWNDWIPTGHISLFLFKPLY